MPDDRLEKSRLLENAAHFSNVYALVSAAAGLGTFALWLAGAHAVLFAGCACIFASFFFMYLLGYLRKSGESPIESIGECLREPESEPKQLRGLKSAGAKSEVVTPKVLRPNLICQRIDRFSVDYVDGRFRRSVEGYVYSVNCGYC